jgi:hypothetical protein
MPAWTKNPADALTSRGGGGSRGPCVRIALDQLYTRDRDREFLGNGPSSPRPLSSSFRVSAAACRSCQAETSPADQWRERIAEQQRSGASIRQFCMHRGFSAYSFYAWRKRLRKPKPVRFALVDRGLATQPATDACVELILPGGERLRITPGMDAGTPRTVLEALRA